MLALNLPKTVNTVLCVVAWRVCVLFKITDSRFRKYFYYQLLLCLAHEIYRLFFARNCKGNHFDPSPHGNSNPSQNRIGLVVDKNVEAKASNGVVRGCKQIPSHGMRKRQDHDEHSRRSNVAGDEKM